MAQVLTLVFLAAVLAWLFAHFVVKGVLAHRKGPASELRHIKVHMEGLQGAVGPGMSVTEITYTGGQMAYRYQPAMRFYIVSLIQFGGGTERWDVTAPVVLFGQSPLQVTRAAD